MSTILNALKTFKFLDAIDIALIAYLTYNLLKFVIEIRAERILNGIVILTIMYGISAMLNLVTLSFVLKNFFAVGTIAIVVVFQPELRKILGQFGRTKLNRLKLKFGNSIEIANNETINSIEILSNTCETMAQKKIGALIAIECFDSLADIAQTGTKLEAIITKELLLNIFFVNTPLHDGAVIINGNRIYTAGCILPLSNNCDISKKYGTRHRAALGLSENSDAVILVVSEERGKMLIAHKGKLIPVKTASEMTEKVLSYLPPVDKENKITKNVVLERLSFLFKRLKKR